MDAIHAARVLMGDSLGFHIIFVMFSLTLPILVVWFEWLGRRRKDQQLIKFAKFLSKIMALLVVAGVLSGTVIALQMSMVWPGILKFGGEVIGLPFMFETFAFLIEATFLALYMATWDNKRVPGWLHLLFGVMVFVGATASAYAITAVNGWMNLPTGFDIVDGKFENIDVLAAMFSVPALVTFFHSMPGYYVASGLLLTGLFAFRILRSKRSEINSKKRQFDYYVIQKLMLFVLVAFIGSAVTADITGKYLAENEPEKLAAIELLYETTDNAPLIVGGVSDGQGGIAGPHFVIPSALSLLACNNPGCTVQGLNETAEDKQPPLVVHTFFDIKMTLITILVVVIPLYFIVRKWRPEWLKNRLLLLGFVLISWFGIAIVELGWMMTEMGRQPWAVRGYVTTEQALTKTHDITTFGYLFPLAYVALFVVTFWAIRMIIKNEKSKSGGAL